MKLINKLSFLLIINFISLILYNSCQYSSVFGLALNKITQNSFSEKYSDFDINPRHSNELTSDINDSGKKIFI